jgi:hypothetical protein
LANVSPKRWLATCKGDFICPLLNAHQDSLLDILSTQVFGDFSKQTSKWWLWTMSAPIIASQTSLDSYNFAHLKPKHS